MNRSPIIRTQRRSHLRLGRGVELLNRLVPHFCVVVKNWVWWEVDKEGREANQCADLEWWAQQRWQRWARDSPNPGPPFPGDRAGLHFSASLAISSDSFPKSSSMLLLVLCPASSAGQVQRVKWQPKAPAEDNDCLPIANWALDEQEIKLSYVKSLRLGLFVANNLNRDENICLVFFSFALFYFFCSDQIEITPWNLRVHQWVENAFCSSWPKMEFLFHIVLISKQAKK